MNMKTLDKDQIKMICDTESAVLSAAFPEASRIDVRSENNAAMGSGAFSVVIGGNKLLSGAYDEQYDDLTGVSHHLEGEMTGARMKKLETVLNILLDTAKAARMQGKMSELAASALDAAELPDREVDLIWMAGSLDAVRQDSYSDGPSPNKLGLITDDAIVLVGKSRNGSVKAVEVWHERELMFEGDCAEDLTRPELDDYFSLDRETPDP